MELVIEGCGQATRLSVPTESLAAPKIAEAVLDGEDVRVVWTGAAGATAASTWAGDGYEGKVCHTVGTGVAYVKAAQGLDGSVEIRERLVLLEAIAAHTTTETPFGTARTWRRSEWVLTQTSGESLRRLGP